MASERGVLRREAPLAVGARDLLPLGPRDPSLTERAVRVGERRVVDRDEAVEAAGPGRGRDPVLALGRAAVAAQALGAGLARERDRKREAPSAGALGDERSLRLAHLDAIDALAGGRRG